MWGRFCRVKMRHQKVRLQNFNLEISRTMAPIHGKKGHRSGRKDPRGQKRVYRPSRLEDDVQECVFQSREDVLWLTITVSSLS